MKHIVAMSLWGREDSSYARGALLNAREMQVIYPGWTLRVYTDGTPAGTIAKLAAGGAEIVKMPTPETEVRGMFWRFLAISEPDATVHLRDADSLVNVREAAAVADWMSTGTLAYGMRDHEHHGSWALMGGMWGIRGGAVPDIEKKIAAWGQWHRRPYDMIFLRDKIQPIIQHSLVLYGPGIGTWKAFPPHPPYGGFVGQRIE
jgi:hypothetical protein